MKLLRFDTIGDSRIRIAVITEPQMTKAVFAKLQPLLSRMNMPSLSFSDEKGLVATSPHVFEIPGNKQDLEDCLNEAHRQVEAEQKAKEESKQDFMNKLNPKDGVGAK